MNITIASICWPDYDALGAITHPTWESYCQRHGYQWYSETNPLTQRGPNWDKIVLVESLLRHNDLVLWAGSDTLVTNPAQKIEDFYAQHDPASIIIGADVYGLNSDVMLFHQGVWSETFLYAVHNIGYHFYHDHPWAEQEAIIRFAHQAPYADHIAIVAQKGFNSYLHQEYGRPTHWPGNWTEGDWILHLPGLPVERRIQLAQEYSTKNI